MIVLMAEGSLKTPCEAYRRGNSHPKFQTGAGEAHILSHSGHMHLQGVEEFALHACTECAAGKWTGYPGHRRRVGIMNRAFRR